MQILNLKEQVETLKGQIPDGDVVEPGLVDELRSRIITQNKAIQTLKEHLSTFKKLEAENLLLREDKRMLEHQVQEVRRKLEFTQHLVKPVRYLYKKLYLFGVWNMGIYVLQSIPVYFQLSAHNCYIFI